MKIQELILRGYKRLMLANIHDFTYTPRSPHQLIQGTNGSGKSSILRELSPLPASAADFVSGGLKKITLTHRGQEYILTSNFARSGPGKHSFLLEQEELNTGGTAQSQKELVRQHFNWTPDLRDLLIGRSNFTEMAPMKRREWITQLSTADYTYALGVYNKFKGQARDALGALNRGKARLAQETQNLMALTDTDGLEGRAAALREELNALLSALTPDRPGATAARRQLDNLLEQIERLAQNILKQYRQAPTSGGHHSLDHIKENLAQYEASVDSTQTLLNHYSQEYADVEAIVQALSKEGVVSGDNLEGAILEREAQVNAILGSFELFAGLQNAAQVRTSSEQVLSRVIGLFSRLPDNSDRRFSRERVEETRAAIQEQQRIKDAAYARLSHVEAKLTNFRNAKDTHCPSCGYVWRDGHSEKDVEQHERWAGDHTRQGEVAEKQIRVLEAFLEESEQVSNQYREFRGLVSGYPLLSPLWDHILEHRYLTDSPSSHLDLFYIWQRDLERACQLEDTKRELQELKDLVARQGAGGGGHFHQRMEVLQTQIQTQTAQLQRVKASIGYTRQAFQQLSRLQQDGEQLVNLYEQLNQLEAVVIDALRNESLQGVIDADHNQLAVIQKQLSDKQVLEGVVADLTRTQEQTQLDYAVFSILSKALSPTDGLIAEQLTGFITCLTAQMNSIIAPVWTYDMSVLPCGMESGELNYSFPLQVRSADNITEDVRDGSLGQRAIINHAFRLTVMLYMQLEDYPLFLDEVEAPFDEAHRVNMMAFVKQLMASNQYSQVFMVSHYAATHGALADAEILVLDGANIAVPNSYNQHVVLA